MGNYVIMALLATLGTWLVTALGAATVAFFKSPQVEPVGIHYAITVLPAGISIISVLFRSTQTVISEGL